MKRDRVASLTAQERKSKALRRAQGVREARKACGSYHERIDFPPLRPGLCDFCGAPCGKRRFCSGGSCAAAYRDLAKHRGAMIYDMVYRWRKLRSVKGATKGLLGQLARRMDAFIAEDRELDRRLAETPEQSPTTQQKESTTCPCGDT